MLRTEIYLVRAHKRTQFAAIISNIRLIIFREMMLIDAANSSQIERCLKWCPVSACIH
jgi:hypothetical protein